MIISVFFSKTTSRKVTDLSFGLERQIRSIVGGLSPALIS